MKLFSKVYLRIFGVRIGLIELVTALFIVLKLTHVIDWSWIWVLSPVLLCILVIVVIFAIIKWADPEITFKEFIKVAIK